LIDLSLILELLVNTIFADLKINAALRSSRSQSDRSFGEYQGSSATVLSWHS